MKLNVVLEKAVLVLLGIVLSGLGYLIKRWLERKPTLERLDVHSKILAINKQMKEQGLTANDLATLEQVLTGKHLAVERHTKEMEKASVPLLAKSDGEFLSQAEMNVRARNNLDIANLKMNNVLGELKLLLDEPEKSALIKAQLAWESFSVEQAEAAAIAYRGGSIYPLIFASELERMAVDRTARLQADLDELRRLGN